MSHMRILTIKETLRKNRSLLQHISCHFCAFCISAILLFTLFPLSLLSCLPALSLSACSTCLSELGRARYTHSTGGGPCLLSINNLWNSEIQVGLVCGRLYHTLEGRLPGTLDEASLSVSAGLTVFLAHHNG